MPQCEESHRVWDLFDVNLEIQAREPALPTADSSLHAEDCQQERV